jgi:hypothetical protein
MKDTITINLPAEVTNKDMYEAVGTIIRALANHAPEGNEETIKEGLKLCKEYKANVLAEYRANPGVFNSSALSEEVRANQRAILAEKGADWIPGENY